MAVLSVIFVALIACSIQSISADHLEPGQGIFKDESDVEFRETHLKYNSIVQAGYQVYLQTVLRNGDGHLINVTETTATAVYIPHKITDDIFDTLMGKKEIVTIDNLKYEKVQYKFSPTIEQRWIGMYPIFSEITLEFDVEEDAREKMNEKNKDFSIWKIHYCASFEGHGYTCIPVFQVLVPTMTLEPDDDITQQWTILRMLN
jgi:hypothetical protein